MFNNSKITQINFNALNNLKSFPANTTITNDLTLSKVQLNDKQTDILIKGNHFYTNNFTRKLIPGKSIIDTAGNLVSEKEVIESRDYFNISPDLPNIIPKIESIVTGIYYLLMPTQPTSYLVLGDKNRADCYQSASQYIQHAESFEEKVMEKRSRYGFDIELYIKSVPLIIIALLLLDDDDLNFSNIVFQNDTAIKIDNDHAFSSLQRQFGLLCDAHHCYCQKSPCLGGQKHAIPCTRQAVDITKTISIFPFIDAHGDKEDCYCIIQRQIGVLLTDYAKKLQVGTPEYFNFYYDILRIRKSMFDTLEWLIKQKQAIAQFVESQFYVDRIGMVISQLQLAFKNKMIEQVNRNIDIFNNELRQRQNKHNQILNTANTIIAMLKPFINDPLQQISFTRLKKSIANPWGNYDIELAMEYLFQRWRNQTIYDQSVIEPLGIRKSKLSNYSSWQEQYGTSHLPTNWSVLSDVRSVFSTTRTHSVLTDLFQPYFNHLSKLVPATLGIGAGSLNNIKSAR